MSSEPNSWRKTDILPVLGSAKQIGSFVERLIAVGTEEESLLDALAAAVEHNDRDATLEVARKLAALRNRATIQPVR